MPAMGKPLVAVPGKAVVFGRATIHDGNRLVPPANPGTDWLDAGPGPRPELTLYLLRLSPRQIARPQLAGRGAFYWLLAPGDYLLVGSPAADAGEPEVVQRHWPLAAMRVLPADVLVCVGELAIESAVTGLALEPEPAVQFGLGEVSVTDQCAALGAELEARFAATDAPPAKRLMAVAAGLDFNSPSLFREVRALLDAAR